MRRDLLRIRDRCCLGRVALLPCGCGFVIGVGGCGGLGKTWFASSSLDVALFWLSVDTHTFSISRRSFAIESDDYCVDFGWLGWRLKSEMVTRTVYSIPIWV